MHLTKYSSWNLYYPDYGENNNGYLSFLVGKFLPFISLLKSSGLISNFFFIRYNDNVGSHIRLRISEEINIPELAKTIINTDDTSYKIVKKIYKREYKRYGGIKNIGVSEFFFECNSELIYELMCNQSSWNYENSLFFSLIFNYILLINNYENQMMDILNIQIDHWKRVCPVVIKDDFLSYAENYYKENKNKIFHLVKKNKNMITSFIMEHEGLTFYNSFYNLDNFKKCLIADSLIHMSNNRFGVLNRDEALLAYVIKELTIEYGKDL